jgi:hypothetical protein
MKGVVPERLRAFCGGAAAAWLAAAVYVVCVAVWGNYRSVFEFDPDEGNNLMKALLLQRGHAFITEIWSDQPPLFAYVLRYAFALFGPTVTVGRLVVLAFAGAAVFAAYDALRCVRGHVAGLAGALLLVTSTQFVQLSMSVMIGLPSIACMLLGVWALVRYRISGRSSWLVASGTLMGLSVATKLFTAFLVPVYGLVVLLWAGAEAVRSRQESKKALAARVLGKGALWAAGFTVALLIGLWPILTAWDLGGLVETHELARESRRGTSPGLGAVLGFLRDDALLFGLAVVGLGRALLVRQVPLLLWAVWLTLAALLLLDHYPVWPHHRLLLTAPAAVLGGYAASLVGQRSQEEEPSLMASSPASSWRRGLVGAVTAVGLAALIVFSHPQGKDRLLRPKPWSDSKQDRRVVAALEPYARPDAYVMSARQIYAFQVGMPVPPSLAVTSFKRMQTGLLDNKTMRSTLEAYRPEVIVLSSRWSGDLRRAVKDAMGEEYSRTYRNAGHQSVEIYVRQDVLARAGRSGAVEPNTRGPGAAATDATEDASGDRDPEEAGNAPAESAPDGGTAPAGETP